MLYEKFKNDGLKFISMSILKNNTASLHTARNED
jgi:hypothetical protein